jgi:predicted ATPase
MEEAQTSPLLRRLLSERPGSSWTELVVDRLGDAESRDLALALLPGSRHEHEAVAESIVRESRGNPFFLSELARSVSAGADLGGAATGEASPAGVTLDGVIRERVSRLPESALRLLEIVAVAGRPVSFSVARKAGEIESRENVLELLRVGHLIRTRGAPGREEIEAYHDRVREAVAASLPQDVLTSHHRRLALALEASGGTDQESLALHWKEAGDRDRAAEHAAEAAHRAGALSIALFAH